MLAIGMQIFGLPAQEAQESACQVPINS